MPRTFTLPRTITKTAIKHIPHKPLKGCPDNDYYDITKAVATLEGMLA